MKKQFLFLTEVITVLNEKGEKRFNKNTSKKSSEPGMSLEWFLENNLKPQKI